MPRFWDERMLDVLGAQLGAQCVYGEVFGVGGREEEQGWVRGVVVSADHGWGCSDSPPSSSYSQLWLNTGIS